MEEKSNNGWIKLYRRMEKWGWYDDIVLKSAFIHCLLKANVEDTEWHGEYLPAGSFVTSIANFADESGLTRKQARRALECLEKSGEITKKGHSRYTHIIVNNWAKFQSKENLRANKGQTEGKQRANRGQTEGKQRATDKEYKNIRNKEYKNIIGSCEPSYTTPSPSLSSLEEFNQTIENVLGGKKE